MKMKWSPYGLRNVDFLFERFNGAIPKETLIKALSFENPQKSGHYIFRDPVHLIDNDDSLVYLCESYPDSCQSLGIKSLAELQISKIN